MSIDPGMTGKSNITKREVVVEAPVWTFIMEDCLDRFPDGHVQALIPHEVERLFADYGYEVSLYARNHRAWDNVEKHKSEFVAYIAQRTDSVDSNGFQYELKQGESFVFPVTAPVTITK